MRDTSIIDKLFLEISQFTKAESPREKELLDCIRAIGRVIGYPHTEDEQGRARLVQRIEERFANITVRAKLEIGNIASGARTQVNGSEKTKIELCLERLKTIYSSASAMPVAFEELIDAYDELTALTKFRVEVLRYLKMQLTSYPVVDFIDKQCEKLGL